MKTIGETVLCSECGKALRGVVGVARGFHVRRHKRPDGKPCRGHLFTGHQPARLSRVGEDGER